MSCINGVGNMNTCGSVPAQKSQGSPISLPGKVGNDKLDLVTAGSPQESVSIRQQLGVPSDLGIRPDSGALSQLPGRAPVILPRKE